MTQGGRGSAVGVKADRVISASEPRTNTTKTRCLPFFLPPDSRINHKQRDSGGAPRCPVLSYPV